jgi:Na+-translocating ferredoxin:NAD+ oxidoreductase RNF subunit RnfB
LRIGGSYVMNENPVYGKLADKLGAPASERFLNLLKAMFTIEEARVCLELFAPATCQELASRIDVHERGLAAMLGNLVDRGMLTRGRTQYAFHPTLTAFHHDISDAGVHSGPHALPQKVKDLWGDFFRNEWCDIIVDGYIEKQQATGQRVYSVWPAVGALEASPSIRPEQILPEEDFRLTIADAERRIISPCACRVHWGVCDHPLVTCYACFDNPRGAYYIDKPDRLLREVSLEENLDLVRSAEEAGLVHIADCYCCTCCCQVLYSLRRAKRFDLLAPSRYLATVDEELCSGCQNCIEKCPFDAVEMRASAASKKLKASILDENCMGCGVCIVGCRQRALTYELVRPPEHIIGRRPGLPAGRPARLPERDFGFYDLD